MYLKRIAAKILTIFLMAFLWADVVPDAHAGIVERLTVRKECVRIRCKKLKIFIQCASGWHNDYFGETAVAFAKAHPACVQAALGAQQDWVEDEPFADLSPTFKRAVIDNNKLVEYILDGIFLTYGSDDKRLLTKNTLQNTLKKISTKRTKEVVIPGAIDEEDDGGAPSKKRRRASRDDDDEDEEDERPRKSKPKTKKRKRMPNNDEDDDE